MVDVGKFKLDPTNPNVMSPEQMEGLRESMRKFGYARARARRSTHPALPSIHLQAPSLSSRPFLSRWASSSLIHPLEAFGRRSSFEGRLVLIHFGAVLQDELSTMATLNVPTTLVGHHAVLYPPTCSGSFSKRRTARTNPHPSSTTWWSCERAFISAPSPLGPSTRPPS